MEGNHYRAAGLLERYHITRQYLKFDSCVIAAAQFLHTSGEALSPGILYPALAHVVRSHAALSARIVGERGRSPGFEGMRNIDLEKAVCFMTESTGDLGSLMEEEFQRPIDASAGLPLWRLTVTRNNEVLFCWHHAIGDGQSGLVFLRSLAHALNETHSPLSEDELRTLKLPTALKFTPSIDEATDLSISFKTFVSAVASVIIPRAWTKRAVWTGYDVADSTADVMKTSVRVISLSADSTSRLLALSREHKSTLTSTLYVVTTSVLSKLVAAQKGKHRFKSLSTTVPVSLRPLVKWSPTIMCEGVSTYASTEPLLLTGFSWEKAAAFAAELHKAIPKTREILGSMKLLFGNFEGFFKSKIGAKREGSFEISNVGQFKLDVKPDARVPEDREWTIGEAFFAQDDGVMGSALKVNVVGSPNGGVNICITWGEGALDNDMAESFVKDLEVAIEQLSRGK